MIYLTTELRLDGSGTDESKMTHKRCTMRNELASMDGFPVSLLLLLLLLLHRLTDRSHKRHGDSLRLHT